LLRRLAIIINQLVARKLQGQFSATEVLAYRDRIEEVWDWPLQSHIPRVMFYLTIPPLAWAAAALVEQFVDAALA
jgi:hypothetical protein